VRYRAIGRLMDKHYRGPPRAQFTGRNPFDAADDGDAYSVAEFCSRHRISVQLFYKTRKQMPRTFNVGTRVLISREAATAWRRGRERQHGQDLRDGHLDDRPASDVTQGDGGDGVP